MTTKIFDEILNSLEDARTNDDLQQMHTVCDQAISVVGQLAENYTYKQDALEKLASLKNKIEYHSALMGNLGQKQKYLKDCRTDMKEAVERLTHVFKRLQEEDDGF